MICDCPLSAALPDIPLATCPENFGQIQKVAFTRLRGAMGKVNEFTGDTIKALENWSPLMMAEDGTKIVVSPYLQAPTTEAGEAITFGGGNETLGGIPIPIGKNPTTFTSFMRSVTQNIVAALKQLQCDSEAGNLGVFLFNQHGQIGCLKDSALATTHRPIPIRALFVGDKVFGGLEAPDSNALNWSFLPNWSDNFVVVKPTDFNPLTDLKKA